jgi:GNAT superfamily N-acetyltransferase
MSSPQIRPATVADAANVAALVDDAYGLYVPRIGFPPAPMLYDYAQVIAEHHAWVVDGGDGSLDGVLVMHRDPNHALLDVVAVRPDLQGTGLGTRLLEFAEDRARAQGHGAIELFSNEVMTESFAYYRRHGYVETDRRVEDNYRRIYLSKALA